MSTDLRSTIKPGAPGYYGALVLMIWLSGCASVAPDAGREEVRELLTERGQALPPRSGQAPARIEDEALSAARAVQVALLNNPDLQAHYARLQLGAADVYAASRVRNPVLDAAWLNSDVAGERDQVSYGLVGSLTDLITLRARRRLSDAAFVALQQSVAAQVLAVATTASEAYFAYVGAQQVAALREQVANAGNLSSRLAERFFDAGNISQRELALQRAAGSEARLAALDAQARAFEARVALATVLGVSAGDAWQVPAQLPMPMASDSSLDTLLAIARRCRLDLAAAHTEAGVQAQRLGLTDWQRWLGDLEVGVEREREPDGARLSGPVAHWELPIFNQGGDAKMRANANWQTAVAQWARLSLSVDNEVRLAHAALANAYARAQEYRTVLVPARTQSVTRAQEEVSYMLLGVFELLELKQREYDAVQGYLEAIEGYWQAKVNLARATGNALVIPPQSAANRIDVARWLASETDGNESPQHHHHHNENNTKDDGEVQ